MATPTAAALPSLPCLCASLRRAARAATQLYDDELRGGGLTTPQFTLLQLLSRAGEMTQGRLGELLALDSTTLSRTLRPLEKSGWIAIRPGDDRRHRHVALAPAGRRKLASAEPRWERVQSRLRALVGDDEWPRMLESLRRLAHAARLA
jgi:DNA-binding MarR family transcriptional regulator